MMLGEFDQEMQNTPQSPGAMSRREVEWKPHDKSGTVGWLAGHVATMVEWLPWTIKTEELDYAPVVGLVFSHRRSTSKGIARRCYDKNVAKRAPATFHLRAMPK